ncbi:hypothetical protein [Moraxella lacunata]|uniref:hypothetical protein n=1 Tax=Moraxella lacunata TaxID=477 RepID=UPI003EDF43E4
MFLNCRGKSPFALNKASTNIKLSIGNLFIKDFYENVRLIRPNARHHPTDRLWQ